jgi:hypothetical protein
MVLVLSLFLGDLHVHEVWVPAVCTSLMGVMCMENVYSKHSSKNNAHGGISMGVVLM